MLRVLGGMVLVVVGVMVLVFLGGRVLGTVLGLGMILAGLFGVFTGGR